MMFRNAFKLHKELFIKWSKPFYLFLSAFYSPFWIFYLILIAIQYKSILLREINEILKRNTKIGNIE